MSYKGYLREIARANRAAEKAKERASKLAEKERIRTHLLSMQSTADKKTEDLAKLIKEYSELLINSLSTETVVNFDSFKEEYIEPPFDPGLLKVPDRPPEQSKFFPRGIIKLAKYIPGLKDKYDNAVNEGQIKFKKALEAYEIESASRIKALEIAEEEYKKSIAEKRAKVEAQHAEIEKIKQDLPNAKPEAISYYYSLFLEAVPLPDNFPQIIKVGYIPESKQLVVEWDFPEFSIIPHIQLYKYIKTKDQIVEVERPITQRKIMYSNLIAQITLLLINKLLKADQYNHVESIVFNGYVQTINKATGNPTHPCLLTIRTNKEAFSQIVLSKVDPIACLRSLNASFSRNPAELVPVRPVIEFNMVDPRFIEETDVMSTLDKRPNLMELTPGEFENLITNLFQAMGLDTKLTQASRDGGVDCVAYDSRPILGGKVVIQAKRYKNTVGVSAVRDLFGTVQNEGASKGILVTTSGYGKASYDFADGKPLELLSGSNLLYLLSKHAGIEAVIKVPDDWKDPIPDSPGGD